MRKICALLLFCGAAIPLFSQDYRTFEAGPVFSTLFLNESFNQYQPQLGGRITFNINKLFAIDTEVGSSLRNSTGASTFDGGYALQFLSGVKTTIRRKNVGFFVKARPGVISYSGAICALFPTPPFVVTRRIALFNIDLGGGMEFSVGRRLLFRYDFGDTIVHQPALTGSFPRPSTNVNNFQFETAVAFRF